MLSPAIKIKSFNKESGVLSASLHNLPLGKRILVEFSNLDFLQISERIVFEESFNSNQENLNSILNFSYKVNSDSDKFIFAKIKVFNDEEWVDLSVATAVFKDEVLNKTSGMMSISKRYISKNDKLEVLINGKKDSGYEFVVNNKNFGTKTNHNGIAKMALDPLSFIEQNVISSKFVKSINIKLIDKTTGEEVDRESVEFVPEKLYALAATNDPSRPGCVILDPDPVAAFSVSTDPFSDFCFDQPLIGDSFTTDGSKFSNTTRIDSQYVNCTNGYVSSAINVVDASCKIYNSPKFVKFNPPYRFSEYPVPYSGSPSLYGLFGSDWIKYRLGFCYSACDADAEDAGARVDPCSFTDQELKKIPRIWIGACSDAIGVNVASIIRGILKSPPKYFHSIIIDINNIKFGEAVNLIFNLSSGERVSKTLVYSSETHVNASGFIEAFSSILSSDDSLIEQEIEVEYYSSSGRIDVKSNNQFYVYPGQIDSTNAINGNQISNDKVKVIKDSKYSLNYEITEPSRLDDISSVLKNGTPTHGMFLSGRFKGLVVPLNSNEGSGVISLDTCPRVSAQRTGLGALIIEQDEPCTYMALVSVASIPQNNEKIVKALPFVKNQFNEVVPSTNPCMTKDGRVFCQALISGKWQIFGYFPPTISDYSSDGVNDNFWIQLTDIGENRHVSASSDSYGNIHLAWETDRFGFTSIQYSCIGKSQKLINRMAISGLISKQVSGSLYNKIFNINPSNYSDNFNLSNSSNISLIKEADLISLVKGANLTGSEFKIAREFTGYIKIEENEFNNLVEEVPGSKIGSVSWISDTIPAFNENNFVSSYIVHFDRINGVSGETSSSSFVASFNGKILRVFVSGENLSRSNEFLKSNKIRYPETSTSFENNDSVLGGSAFLVDENTLNFSFTYNDSESVGPLQLRILVESSYESGSLDQSEWSRIHGIDGRVSVSSYNSVCLSGSPKEDVAIASVAINKDSEGNYIEGQESDINFSVFCDCEISPVTKTSKIIFGPELQEISPNNYESVIERQSEDYVWGLSQPIPVISEFSGEPGFSQDIQYASYFNGSVYFEDTNNRYLAGFSSSSNIVTYSLSFRSLAISSTVYKEIQFESNIVALYIYESQLLDTDVLLGNQVYNRTDFANNQGIKFSINKSRQKLTITIPSDVEIDFSFRVVLDGSNISNPFSIKSDLDINKSFDNFAFNFTNLGKNIFSFDKNRFTLNKTDKRYDSIIPILGSLKFDDINSNPKSIYSNFKNIGQLSTSVEDIDASCNDVSSSGTYLMSSSFRVDGEDYNLNHSYIFLVPERVSFIAKNSETIDEYSIRNGSISGYREAIIKDVYTGYAKVGILINGFYSAGLDTTFSKGVNFKLEDLATVKIDSKFSLQVDFSYARMSKDDVSFMDAISHPAEDVFLKPSQSKPYYHLLVNVFANDMPKISANAQIDLSYKSRQWDVSFGMPFGLDPICRSSNINIFELLSKDNWEINFSNIKVGPSRVSLYSNSFENGNLAYSSDKLFKLIPNSDSNVENDEFEQSIIDPGDWICLEDSNSLIDEWSTVNGGCIYVGTYADVFSGQRSILLESNVPYKNENNNSYYNLPLNKLRRGRSSTGTYGGISQNLGTSLDALNELHYFYMTTGVRPLPENLPKLTKTLLIKMDSKCYTFRQTVPTGIFDSPNANVFLKTTRNEFQPSAQTFNLQILNVSDNVSGIFSHFHCTTDEPIPILSNSIGVVYKDAIFYIDNTGILKCSKSVSELDGTPLENTNVSTETVDFGEPFDYIYVDSRLRYENDFSAEPFAIAVTKDGFLETLIFDENENEIPSVFRQSNIPSDGDYVSVSLGWSHGAALKSDGTVTCWGTDVSGSVSGAPLNTKFISIRCGQNFTVGIKEDGQISAWGDNSFNRVSGAPAGIFVKLDAGSEHCVAIRNDGMPISWGRNSNSVDLIDPQVKLIDVAACGGNVYSLQSGTPGSTLGIYNVQPFNVGIDVDGNVISWGKYISAFTKIANASEGYHSVPDIQCVAVKHGFRNCVLLGSDGKIYAYGISSSPTKSGNQSPLDSIYKKYNDYFSGGVFINDCKIFPESVLIDESSDADSYRFYGLSSEKEMVFTFGLYSNKISSVPLCDNEMSLQKNPVLHCDYFEKVSLVYESNILGPWSINEKSSIYLDRYLQDNIILSDTSYSSFNPSIDSDSYGNRVVVWNSISNNYNIIEHAKNTSHPDYVSECQIDKIISTSRIIGLDVDPYDPYESNKSLMSCRVDVSFTAPVSASYFFNISFVDLNDSNIVYKASSSRVEPGKWLVNGKFMPYNGQTLFEKEVSLISYIPDFSDDVFGRVMKVIIEYSTELTQTEEFEIVKLHNISEGTSYESYGPPTYITGQGLAGANEYFVFSEAEKISSINISKQDEAYFESQGSSAERNFIFPSGVDSLPGLNAGSFAKSFLIVLQNNGQTSPVAKEASITFSAPIVAVIIDERGLELTDSHFRDPANPTIVRRSGVIDSFQFYSGEYIKLRDDGKTLDLRFFVPLASSWPNPGGQQNKNPKPTFIYSDTPTAINVLEFNSIIYPNELNSTFTSLFSTTQGRSFFPLAAPPLFPYATIRVILANTGSVSGSIQTTFYCEKPIVNLCRINALYENFNNYNQNVHFKLNVYSDSEYSDPIMVFSSKEDSDLWNAGVDEFPINGILAYSNSTVVASFNPPVINPGRGEYPVDSSDVSESISNFVDNYYYNLNRKLFVCDVRYYVKVIAIVDEDEIELYRNYFVCNCYEELPYRELQSDWSCSFNGSVNTEISKGLSRKSHPSVSGTRDGLFMLAWEDSRGSSDSGGLNNKNNIFSEIYSAILDIPNNKIDSSIYQGNERLMKNSKFDTEFLEERYPIVTSDYFGNFTISSLVDYNKIFVRHSSVGYKIEPTIIEESSLVTACSFTLTESSRYSSAFENGEFLYFRVAEKHIKGYSVSGKERPIAIVNDCFIDIEVVGAPGAIAYRVRNESDSDFTDWIPIGSNLQPLDSLGKSIGIDDEIFRETFKARWIGNEIFLAPWVLSSGNGLKRICIEILTQFGKTQQVCLDVLAEYANISYVVEVGYSLEGENNVIFNPIRYKGIPVVNRKTWYSDSNINDKIILSEEDLRSLSLSESKEVDVFVKVTFEDVQRISKINTLNQIKRFVERRKSLGEFGIYLYQQGSAIQFSELKELDIKNGSYYGKFKIKKNNGVTHKDGLAFIFVNIPYECLNPYVKDFNSVIRNLSDPLLDISRADVVDDNKFIENYLNSDKRNAFGSKRIT